MHQDRKFELILISTLLLPIYNQTKFVIIIIILNCTSTIIQNDALN